MNNENNFSSKAMTLEEIQVYAAHWPLRNTSPCCEKDIAKVYARMIERQERAQKTGLVIGFERIDRVSNGKKTCDPAFEVAIKKHNLTGETLFQVRCERLWEYMRERTFDDRNRHLTDFAKECSENPLLHELKPILRVIYEVLFTLGYSNVDLRQLCNFGILPDTEGSLKKIGRNEHHREDRQKAINELRAFSVPDAYEGLIFETKQDGFAYAAQHLTDNDTIKPEYQDDTFSPQSIGTFDAFLFRFSDQSPEKLVSDIWKNFCHMRELIKNEAGINECARFLILAGVLAERLSWKIQHEEFALRAYKKRCQAKEATNERNKKRDEDNLLKERHRALTQAQRNGKTASDAARYVEKNVGGTFKGNRAAWYKLGLHKK